jgi:pyruvate dehydrogenase E1 component alpha subunit
MAGMLSSMCRIRRFEEKLSELFAAGMLHGTTHLYIGEEAVAAGVCAALTADDMLTSTHRGHGHCIARGMDINAMMAEMFGRATGVAGGRGGSMHMADLAHGNLGTNGVVGGGHGLAVGAALALKMKKKDGIVACFFGDGASNEGSFHEAANLAAIWNLPVLFVCENNGYGFSMATGSAMRVESIAVRAQSYGFPGRLIDGNDAAQVYAETVAAREYVLRHGPMLLECRTYRVAGHSKNDKNAYRTQDEIDAWKKRDPIPRLMALMMEAGFSPAEIHEIDTAAMTAVEDAVAFAQASPYPESGTAGVFAPCAEGSRV